ncbi:MAG TPA: DUF2017 family protein [Actinomycetota bacterium]
MAPRRVRRGRRGGFELRIPPGERDVLRALPAQLRSLLTEEHPSPDPAMQRLFPPAYLDDLEAAREFAGVVRDDLVAERLRAIETMERTIDARRLSEDELGAWLATINDLRLVLGVRLGVSEESGPEDFEGDHASEQAFALYAYLSALEGEVVDALAPLGTHRRRSSFRRIG